MIYELFSMELEDVKVGVELDFCIDCGDLEILCYALSNRKEYIIQCGSLYEIGEEE